MTEFWARPAIAIICDLNRAIADYAPLTKIPQAVNDLVMYRDPSRALQRLTPDNLSPQSLITDLAMASPYGAGVVAAIKWEQRIARAAHAGQSTAKVSDVVPTRDWGRAYGSTKSLSQTLDKVLTAPAVQTLTKAARDRLRTAIEDIAGRAVLISDMQIRRRHFDDDYIVAEAQLKKLSLELKTLLKTELHDSTESAEIQTWFGFIVSNVLTRLRLQGER